MKHLTALKYLVAYYVRHHCEPQDFDDIGGEAAFIDDAANLIQDKMPTADIERIRPYLIDGNVNEWIPLGQAIDEALNPVDEREPWEDDGYDPYNSGFSRFDEEHDYKFGNWRL
jgi:hypothetical protein